MRDFDSARRREPYHYTSQGTWYLAAILAILQRGQSIPVETLKVVYRLLLPYGPNGDSKK